MANIWYIQVNRHCNNACHFCSNPDNWNNISYEKWIELIDDFLKRKYQWIIFTGWEPTLSPDLPRWIKYANEKWIENRMISNWMTCANPDFIKRLSNSWLKLIHFSVYSCHEKIHDFLTDTPWSWKKLMISITNALNSGIRVQINTVINHYNQNHLDKTVKFLSKTFPPINHFVWNNLDPMMIRKNDIALKTLPSFKDFKESLNLAMQYLEKEWKTFRVESVPLCYMRWFEWASTETRKIVKQEERIVHFLDERKISIQKAKWFKYDKEEECNKCDLNDICAWIWFKKSKKVFWNEYNWYYSEEKYIPQVLSKIEKDNIIKKIKI